MMKRFPILIFAGVIDTFQFLVGAAIVALPFTGAAAGAAGAAYFCQQHAPGWQWVQGACTYVGSAIGSVLGFFAGSAALPVGVVIAPAIIFAIGIVFGPMLLVALLYTGAFNAKIVVPAFLGELVPFVGGLPLWSVLAWRCVRDAAQKEKLAISQIQEDPEQKNGFSEPVQPKKIERSSPDIRRPGQTGVAVALLLLLISLGAAPSIASAQIAPDPVRFTAAPDNPGPSELVVVVVDGIGISIGEATITWQLNGKTVLSGVGERKFSFTTGALGSTNQLTATVQVPGQGSFTKSFNFSPSLVHLLWEADTTTPFFYRGAALYSPGSSITVVAFPNVVSGGKEVSSRALSYSWSVNGAPVPAQSGLGHTILTVDGDQLQDGEQIAVDVFLNTAQVGHGELSIPNTDPQLLLYYRDSLRGILYDTALPASVSLTGQELSLRAEPYYFSNSSLRNGALAYSWLLNGEDTSGPDSAQGFLTLRRNGGAAGNADISVSLQNTDSSRLGQSASAAVQVLFGAQASAAGSSLGAAILSAFGPLVQPVPAENTALTYQPLEPIPNYNPNGCTSIAVFLNASLKILISAGAIFSVLTLTVGGVMYMMSDIVNVKSKAKERMWAAIWGLVLIIAAYLILNTINPQLVNFANLFQNNCSTTSGAANQSSSNQTDTATLWNVDPNSTQGKEMRQLACKDTWISCGYDGTYVLFNEQTANSPEVAKFQSDCLNKSVLIEGSGVYGPGTIHFGSGDIVGVSNASIMVCGR